MKDSNMKARISMLHKTEYEWNLLHNFIPFSGEFIIFDKDLHYDYIRVKIGDGKTLLQDLPFLVDSALDDFVASLQNCVFDAGRITNYKK